MTTKLMKSGNEKKHQVDVLMIFKVIGCAIILGVMGYSQFHTPRPIPIPNELWTVATAVITYMFLGIMPKIKEIESGQINWIKGIVACVLIAMVGASIILGKSLGKEWWGVLGVAIAFLYGTSK